MQGRQLRRDHVFVRAYVTKTLARGNRELSVVVEPRVVTELLPDEPHDVLACGPEPMLAAVRALVPSAQLAWEAPMACGYGACYGCAVEIDGELKRLCVEGPVLCAA